MAGLVGDILKELFTVYDFAKTVGLLASRIAYLRDTLSALPEMDEDEQNYQINGMATCIFYVYIQLLNEHLQTSQLKLGHENREIVNELISEGYYEDIARYCIQNNPSKNEQSISEALFAQIKQKLHEQLRDEHESIVVGNTIQHDERHQELDNPKHKNIKYKTIRFLYRQVLKSSLPTNDNSKEKSSSNSHSKPVVLICAKIDADLTRAIDLLRALIESEADPAYDFAAVIYCSPEYSKSITAALSDLHLAEHWLVEDPDDTDHIYEEPFKTLAQQVKQIIILPVFASLRLYKLAGFPNLDLYIQKCGEDQVPVKQINDHEDIPFKNMRSNNRAIYPMGLSDKAYGILLSDLPRKNTAEVLVNIQETAPELVSALLKATQTTAKTFSDQNLIVPSQLKKTEHFFKYLYLLIANKTLPKEKSICIIMNSCDASFLSYLIGTVSLFAELPYEEIVCIASDGKQITIPLHDNLDNPGKTLFILHGAELNADHFTQLCQCTELPVAVDDEAHFESAISAKALPYYARDNVAGHLSIDAMKTFVEQKVETKVDDSKACEELISFLDPVLKDYKFRSKYFDSKQVDSLTKLNLLAMTQAWQQIAKLMCQGSNFYDKLPAILAEQPKVKQLDAKQAGSSFFSRSNNASNFSINHAMSNKSQSQRYLEAAKREIEATEYEVSFQLFSTKIVLANGQEKKVPQSILKLYDVIRKIESKANKKDEDWEKARAEFEQLAKTRHNKKFSFTRKESTKTQLDKFSSLSKPELN